jgi:hypothetical protein
MDRRRWLTVALESGIFWPAQETTVRYEGHDFVLRPETDQLAPSVALAFDDPSRDDEALLLIRRFLSSLSWIERGYLRETVTLGTGGVPGRIGKGPGARMINPQFRVDYLPSKLTARAQLCLALYREAQNLNSIPFQFLGFFKVINALHKRGPEQKNWINKNIDHIIDYRAQERLRELRRSQQDMGSYLYESGRCAVAHAFNEPIVDPDNPQHTRRLIEDLPVIKALAEVAIERELGVKSLQTFRREHLYQLEGFRALFGPALVAELKAKRIVALERVPPLPHLSFRTSGNEPYKAFEDLTPEIIVIEAGIIWSRCRSNDRLVAVGIGLDFACECIDFDLKTGVMLADDGSPAPVRYALDDNRFYRDMVTNGELETWNFDIGELLGRADPLLPINIDIGRTVAGLEARRRELEKLLAARTDSGRDSAA